MNGCKARNAGSWPQAFSLASVRSVRRLCTSVVIRAAGPFVLGVFPGHLCDEFGRVGEAGMGVWGKTWNRAVWGARGVPGFPPVRFPIGPPSLLFTREAEP
jgi:hypothetical protein